MLTILSVLFCLGLYIQDLLRRRVHVALLLLLAGTGWVQRWMSGEEHMGSSLLSNLLVILFLLTGVWAFYHLKGEKHILDHKLGSGDVGMLLALACCMNPADFLGFYLVSTLILLLVFGGLRLSGRIAPDYPIPLAGLWALVFAGWLLWQMAMS